MIIKKKEFTYKGKTLSELKALDVREFSKYLPSRQKRSVLRNFQEIEKFINRAKEKISRGKKIRTHQRDLIVVPEMIGMKIQVYNGHVFSPIEISEEMLGHRLGEFAPTRGKVKHGAVGIGATKGTKHKAKK